MKTLKKFAAEFKASWHLTLEYRLAVFIWIFAMLLPLIMLAGWLSMAQDGPIGRFKSEDFIAYYIALGLGSKPIRTGLLVPVVIGLPFLVPGVHFASDPLLILFFMVAVVGGWAIAFLIQYTTGLLGFWITQSLNIHDVWFTVFSLFSGYLIPLELFPPAFKKFLYVTPFRYMLSLPVEIFTKQLNSTEILKGLAIQWMWVTVFFLVYRFVWTRGLKQYSAVGA